MFYTQGNTQVYSPFGSLRGRTTRYRLAPALYRRSASPRFEIGERPPASRRTIATQRRAA